MHSRQLPQLFLLHYAGGNSYSYNFLKRYLEPNFDVVCIELPGRGKRMREAILHDRKEAVRDQFDEIKKHRKQGVDFAIYGHSMGAVLALGVAYEMEAIGDIPRSLIVTGHAGPGSYRNESRFNLDTPVFKEELRKLGGVPEEVLTNDELFGFFEPILRADFEVVERQSDTEMAKVNCPVHCVMGSTEKYIHKIAGWKNYTNSNFSYEIFEGNHFFINDQPEKLAQFIKEAFNDSLALQY
ncbi:MAG: thioesterase II family protein [Fluviicola sp.]